MLLCPIVGPCFFLISHAMYLVFFSDTVDLEDVIFSKERVKTYMHADEDRERNVVPLEEAIEITDKENLRNLMMNIVRGDINQSLSKVAMALDGEDTETAHYAASVLQDILNDFRNKVQKSRELIGKEENNQIDYASSLIEYMDSFLSQHVLTDMEQKTYVNIMDEICELIYQKEPLRLLNMHYESVAIRLLEIKDFEKSQKWCERAVYHHPNTLSTYTMQLKLYFTSNQKEKFFSVLEELRGSSVVIDKETLEMIRVFL
ncbi:MAG: hypothetical protein J6L65_07305 [Lachnospiraceae bacterium]|nr:hypothetical protein [Lachnospiraceae bacterium]